MKKGLVLHTILLAGNLGLFLGMTLEHGAFVRDGRAIHCAQSDNRQVSLQGEPAGLERCRDLSDDPPGVTVYLETSPARDVPPAGPQPSSRWTAVSVRDAGQAADGSRQTVISIEPTEIRRGAVDLPSTTNTPRWQ